MAITLSQARVDRLVLIRVVQDGRTGDSTAQDAQPGKLIAAEIIDFKTETYESSSDEARELNRNRYEMQIAAYRRAARSSLRIENVSTRLVYLH